MSGDLRPVLERARQRAPLSRTGLDDLLRARSRRRRRERGIAIVVGLTLTLATIGGGALVVRERDGRGGPDVVPTNDAATRLDVPAGEFWYRDALVFGLNECDAAMTACGFSGPDSGAAPFPYVGSSRIELWWSPDGPARVVSHVFEPTFFSPSERDEFETLNGPIGTGERTVEDYVPGDFAEAFPDDDPAHGGLSSDPAVLARQLEDRLRPDAPSPVIQPTPEIEGQGGNTPALVRVLQALLPNAQPSLQAALFDVASTWEGMRVREAATDPGGRSAIELSISTEGQLHSWFFDRENHQLLASVEADGDGDAYQAIVVVASGFASALGDAPAPGAELIRPPMRDASPIADPRA